MPILDPFGALLTRHAPAPMPGCGPLGGCGFVVKDNIDVAGEVTGAGNPAWRAAHARAERSAPVVTLLADAGAHFVGRAVMDELAYGVEGINAHDGTPVNPAVPARLCGGSSCGSAAAVAGGLADFGLGTDTGGSVRVPAAACGLFGIRPTWGRLPMEGVVPLAPRLDTVGWMARSGDVFLRVANVLLDARPEPPRAFRLLVDCLAALEGAAGLAPPLARLRARAQRHVEVRAVDPGQAAPLAAYRALQGRATQQVLGSWVSTNEAALSPAIAERFRAAAAVSDAEVRAGELLRGELIARLSHLLGDDGVLLRPTLPGPPPERNAGPDELGASRAAILSCTALASLTGFPEVTLPGLTLAGAPVGLSLLGPPGSDAALCALAVAAAGR